MNRKLAQVETHMIKPSAPFEIIAIDYTQVPRSDDYSHILIIVDLFTKWTIAIPTDAANALTTTRSIVDSVICYHGTPRIIISDNGSEFKNVFAKCCEVLGIKQQPIPPHHPQSDIAERYIGSVKRVLITLYDDHANQWLPLLQPAIFALNSAPSVTNGISPFLALFGRLPRMPFDLPESEPTGNTTVPERTDSQATALFNQIIAVQHEVHAYIDHEAAQDWLTEKKLPTIPYFRPGDLVQIIVTEKLDHPHNPLVRTYIGPYQIVQRIGQVIYSIVPVTKDEATGKYTPLAKVTPTMVHISRIKPYQVRELNDPEPVSQPLVPTKPAKPTKSAQRIIHTDYSPTNPNTDSIAKRVSAEHQFDPPNPSVPENSLEGEKYLFNPTGWYSKALRPPGSSQKLPTRSAMKQK
jgi:transposase InsO family protein